jgi:protein TonB
MEPKKSPKADLETKKAFFTELGFILTLALLLVVFGWKTYDIAEIEITTTGVTIDDQENAPITSQSKPTPPMVIKAPTDLTIVDNTFEVEDIGPIDMSDSPDQPTPKYDIPLAKPIEEPPLEEEPVIVADVEPEFPGGLTAMHKFLGENLVYPQVAKETGITGIVYVTFIVEKDGSITNYRIQRGVEGGCSEEAIRVIQLMPKWKPAWNKGQLVRKIVLLPIKFELK